MIISTDAEKALDNIQHLFMLKKKKEVQKLEIEWNYLNLIKSIYENSVSSLLNVKRLNAFPHDWEEFKHI